MKPFSFVHMADIHLGYTQYNLPERAEDFAKAFIQAVDEVLKLKPDFVVMAGDIFESPRPSNKTLATGIRELKRLRDAGIKVFAVDGSHDLEPNVIIGTVLKPLHNAGLLVYLPEVKGGWEDENFYIYGLKSSRTLLEADIKVNKQLKENPPNPRQGKFNILCFHGALEGLKLLPPGFKPDLRPSHLPAGFQYYAGGHLHKPFQEPFKTGILVYPGSLETTSYDEAEYPKGFFHVQVESLEEKPAISRIDLENVRKFRVEKLNFSAARPEEVMAKAEEALRRLDEPEAIVVLVLRGQLAEGFKRSHIDVHRLRKTCKEAFHTLIVNQLSEAEMKLKPIHLRKPHEIKTLAYQHLLKIFQAKHPGPEGERRAKAALELLEPLMAGEREKVEAIFRRVVKADSEEA
ncbi:hypothetical protein DRO53_01410 [Candidatus Bathyarchaeota archaeon]|nr:MAG: hypothetical protein DRO53_01410 [Candidatus Bathyarchaeota archaeon]